jgi:hypothetical protein
MAFVKFRYAHSIVGYFLTSAGDKILEACSAAAALYTFLRAQPIGRRRGNAGFELGIDWRRRAVATGESQPCRGARSGVIFCSFETPRGRVWGL